MLGTAYAYRQLLRRLHAIPGFPCCAFPAERGGFELDPCLSCRPPRHFPRPVPCVVDDQGCLQVALAALGGGTRSEDGDAPRVSAVGHPRGALGGHPRRELRLSHSLDRDARLFLNLHDLLPSDLEVRGGRLAFKHSGQVPCVIHANGDKAALHALLPLLEPVAVWCAPPTSA